MPQICPRCQFAQADENQTCINCGVSMAPISFQNPSLIAEAPTSAPASGPEQDAGPAPGEEIRAPRDSGRKSVLLATAGLFVLGGVVLLAALQKPPARPPLPVSSKTPLRVTSLPSPPVAPERAALTPVSPARTRPKTAVPVTVTLVASNETRPIKVGAGVTLTALTNLAPGQSASLTLTYRRGHGRNTLFSFAQGSLLSTIWTPPAPGRYDFLATALEGRQKAAASRPISILVVADHAGKSPLLTAALPSPKIPQSLPQAPRPASLLGKPRKKAAAAKHAAPSAASARLFHVAAAHFPFAANAVVLAGALHNRGYHATPERMADKQGKAVYVVVTGSYRRAEEARQQVLILQSSGYPAYFFSSR